MKFITDGVLCVVINLLYFLLCLSKGEEKDILYTEVRVIDNEARQIV